MATILEGNIQITGSLDVAQGITGQERGGLSSESSKVFPINLSEWRVWDAFCALLSGAANDDLGVTAGAFGTGCPYIVSRDLNALGAVTGYARATFTLPVEYVATGPVQFRVSGGMLTAVASVSATVDVEIYKTARNTLKTGSDLVTTAATSINSTTFAEKVFDLTYSGLNPGDTLDIRLAIAANSATASSHFAALANTELLLTIKG